jgi:hypothetical protein
MPDLYRATFAFSGKKQGWSESYVFPADNTTPLLLFGTTIQPIAIARANLLAREYVLDACRVAKIRLGDGTPVKRQVKLFSPDLGPSLQTVANTGEQPRSCLVVQASGADGQGTKHVFMRGIPDAIAIDGGDIDPNGAGGFGARFATWRGLMLAAGAGWLGDLKVGEPFNVEGYVSNPGLTVSFSLAGTPLNGVAVNSRVPIRFKQINGKSKLNGLQTVIVDSPSSCTTVRAIAVADYTAGGVGQRYNPIRPFHAAGDWGMSLIRTRDTGRPSYATRGRRSAVPLI